MFTLVYDSEWGTPFRDGETKVFVDNIVERIKLKQDFTVTCATENLLNAVRVAVRHKRIALEDITLQFQHPGIRFGKEDWIELPRLMTLRLYKSGGISPWPVGFADHAMQHLMELL